MIPVNGLFVVDFKIEFQLYHWWNHDAGGIKYRNEGQDTFKADSVQGLYELMRGVDTDYPHLAGFWQDGNANQAEVHDGILHLLDYRNRSYTLDLDKTRVIENNENYKVIDLESVAHGGAGDVVDLSEEENVPGPLHAMSAKTDPAEFADAEVIKSRLDALGAKLDGLRSVALRRCRPA